MNKKKILSIVFAFILLVTAVGCGAKQATETYPYEESVEESPAAAMEARNVAEDRAYNETEYYEDADYVEAKELEQPASPDSGSTGGGEVAPEQEVRQRKLVYTKNLDLQTLEFENSIKLLEDKIEENGGYIESSSVMNGDISTTYSENYYNARNASYSIKVPGKSSDSFMDFLQENFHVTNSNSAVQDITGTYYDSQTMLESHLEHEERLKQLLDKGGDLEYLLEIEREIANVRYQINSINSSLKNMDTLVDFNTINITLYEVIKYEETTQIDDSFATRVSRAFSESWINFVDGAQNLFISLIYMIPSLIILAIIAVIAIIILLKVRKKPKQKRAEGYPQPQAMGKDALHNQPTPLPTQPEDPHNPKSTKK